MKRDRTDRERIIGRAAIAVLVLFAIGSFYVAFFASLHLHTLADGRVVVHSHALPQNGGQGRAHSHTHHEFALIDGFLKSVQADSIGEMNLPPTDLPLIERLCPSTGAFAVCVIISPSPSRAPPVCIS